MVETYLLYNTLLPILENICRHLALYILHAHTVCYTRLQKYLIYGLQGLPI